MGRAKSTSKQEMDTDMIATNEALKYYSVIYAYTTALKKEKGRVKTGSTRRLAASAYEAAKQRIAEQSTAISSDDPAIILEIWDVNDLCETGDKHDSLSNLRTLEQSYLHKELKAKGMWFAGDEDVTVKDSSEWFYADTVQTVVDEVSSLINQKRFGVLRPNSYKMREEQQECHDKAVAHYIQYGAATGEYLGAQFLINAKMRFGKTFVSYQIVKSLQEKFGTNFKVLVLTYKPAVEAGWAEDLKTHVDFDGWNYHYAKDFDRNNPVVLGDSKVEVLFASFQDLNDMDKPKWINIKDYTFDMVIIDEQHYGTQTSRAQSTLQKLNYDRLLEVSGTPLHALMSGRFEDDEIYSWTYSDEQRKRNIEKDNNWETEIYRWLPVMNFMTFEVSEQAKSQAHFYDAVEGFTMQKMFASNDGDTFIDEASVSLWLEEAYGLNCHKNKSPVKQYNSDNMVWKLPSVNSCTAMEKLINKLDFIKHSPIVVSGDKGADLVDVKNHIRRFDKTVTLTCGSLMTGTTVPEWDMIFMLDGGISAQDYFQTIFRVQSSNKKANKEKCFVVDYNPQRLLQMVYNFAEVQSENVSEKSTQQNVQEFLDFAPIMDHTGNKPVPVALDDVLSLITPASHIEGFRSTRFINTSVVNEQIFDILTPVKQETNTKREVEVSNNNIELGKNKTNVDRKKAEVDLDAKEQRELIQKAVTVCASIVNYLVLEDKKIDNIKDILYTNNVETFYREVGITLEDFEKLCNCKFIKVNKINRKISAFQQAMRQFSTE